MRLYRKNSLFSSRIIRKITYGCGRGVHSPKAFSIVNSLICPSGIYYDFERRVLFRDSREYKLVYRTVARLRPSKIILLGAFQELSAILKSSFPTTSIVDSMSDYTDNTLIITGRVSLIRNVSLKNCTIIIMGVRKTSDEYRLFNKYVEELRSGIVIDLYNSALIAGVVPSIKYIYRSSL